jgi:hypothetical protein
MGSVTTNKEHNSRLTYLVLQKYVKYNIYVYINGIPIPTACYTIKFFRSARCVSAAYVVFRAKTCFFNKTL